MSFQTLEHYLEDRNYKKRYANDFLFEVITFSGQSIKTNHISTLENDNIKYVVAIQECIGEVWINYEQLIIRNMLKPITVEEKLTIIEHELDVKIKFAGSGNYFTLRKIIPHENDLYGNYNSNGIINIFKEVYDYYIDNGRVYDIQIYLDDELVYKAKEVK